MTASGAGDFSEHITIELTHDPDLAKAIERSIRVERSDLADDRTRTHISRNDGTIEIHIEATDLIGLRAATNTWVGLLKTAEATASLVPDRV